MQGVKRAGALVASLMFIIAVAAPPAYADTASEELQFVELINAERRAAGAPELVVVGDLVAGARAHAAWMAETDRFEHNKNLGDITDGWKLLGENIGRGGDVESLHRAFMQSDGHRQNLLNPAYDAIGVGVVWANGIPHVSQVFMDSVEPPVAYRPPFIDDDDSVFEADIVALYELGITRGCAPDRFCPDRAVTRGEMATMLVRAFGLTGSGGPGFVDTEASPHRNAVEILAANGITRGCAAEKFCPDRSITRAEMAVFLSRILGLPPASPAGFVDTQSSEASGAIDSLALAGITRGCGPDVFCPTDDVTRGQLASFLMRALRS